MQRVGEFIQDTIFGDSRLVTELAFQILSLEG